MANNTARDLLASAWTMVGVGALASAACGNESAQGTGSSETSGATGTACVPGTTIACPCLGGANGVQTCREDGSGFDECMCGGTTSSGSAGTTDAGTESGTTDLSTGSSTATGHASESTSTGRPLGALGDPCTVGRDCESGNCSDEVCCDATCDGPCDACAFDLGAAQDGACTLVPFTNPGAPSCEPQVCDGQSAQCVDACVSEPAQPVYSPVDYVFVIDNSGSMAEELFAVEANIQSNLADLLEANGIDYQVIMVSDHGISSYAICVGPPLSSTVDCSQAPGEVPGQFYHYDVNVQSLDSLCKLLDTFGGPNAGGEADQWGLHPDGWGALLRPEAFKVFVVLSDDRAACTWNAVDLYDQNAIIEGQAMANVFDQELLALSPEQFGVVSYESYAFYPLIGLEPKPNPADPYLPAEAVVLPYCMSGGVNPGTGYQWLAKSSGGRRYASCAWMDFAAIFQDLTQASMAQAALPCTYALPDPAPETLDLDNLRMVFTPAMGAATLFLPVADSAACLGVSDGFYVEGMAIHVCPDACAIVESDPDGQLRVDALCEP